MSRRHPSLAKAGALAFTIHLALLASMAHAGNPTVLRAGDPDPTFGENGRVTVPSRGFAHPSGDGKYWVVAKRDSPPGRVEVRRLLENGMRDPTFPLNGTIVDLYPGAQDFELFGMRLQSSGKIILAGRLFLTDGTTSPLFARLGLDGQLDPSFGRNGIQLIDFDDATATRYIYGIAIQGDDKIVASTLSAFDGKIYPRLVRLDAHGAQDAGFGRNGVVYDVPQGMIFLSTAAFDNGKLLFGGLSEPDDHAVLMRLRGDGSIDGSFGQSGFVSLEDRDHLGMRVGSIALSTADDSVIVGGISRTESASGWVSRILPDGAMDGSFNNGSPLFVENLSVYTLGVQDDGRVILHGTSRGPSQSQMAIGRLNRNGSFDTSFGLNGIALTPLPAQSAFSNAYSYSEIQGPKLFVSDVVEYDGSFQIQLLRYALDDQRRSWIGATPYSASAD